MSREAKLREAIIKVTGDDTIIDVAEFSPRGTAGAAVAGAVAGSFAGGAAGGDGNWGSSLGSAIGVGAGAYAGQTLVAKAAELPKFIGVGVTPHKVYILGVPEGFWKPREEDAFPIAQIERGQLGVEVHQRVQVRVLVLEDLQTGARFELEVPRLNFYHAKALIELLMVSEEHHEEQEAPAAS